MNKEKLLEQEAEIVQLRNRLADMYTLTTRYLEKTEDIAAIEFCNNLMTVAIGKLKPATEKTNDSD